MRHDAGVAEPRRHSREHGLTLRGPCAGSRPAVRGAPDAHGGPAPVPMRRCCRLVNAPHALISASSSAPRSCLRVRMLRISGMRGLPDCSRLPGRSHADGDWKSWRQSPSRARCSSSLRCTARPQVPQGAPPRTAATGGSRTCGCHSTSSAAATFSDSPYHSGVAVCGPIVMPAAASRATVGASGAPAPCHCGAGGTAGSGVPSGRRNWNRPAASATT